MTSRTYGEKSTNILYFLYAMYRLDTALSNVHLKIPDGTVRIVSRVCLQCLAGTLTT